MTTIILEWNPSVCTAFLSVWHVSFHWVCAHVACRKSGNDFRVSCVEITRSKGKKSGTTPSHSAHVWLATWIGCAQPMESWLTHLIPLMYWQSRGREICSTWGPQEQHEESGLSQWDEAKTVFIITTRSLQWCVSLMNSVPSFTLNNVNHLHWWQVLYIR